MDKIRGFYAGMQGFRPENIGVIRLREEDVEAVVDHDAVLTAVSGVGKRLAGRIVLELKEKVDAAGSAATSDGGGESEVVAALEALGYSSRESHDAARAAVAASMASS